MDHSKGIYWHQGMFMQPQHFQLTEQSGQFRIKPLMETGLPHFWGVGKLEVSRTAIANRFVEVLGAHLLFPDHTYVEVAANAVVAPRRFDDVWCGDEKALTVYLGLRRLSDQGSNVTLCDSLEEAASSSTRYATLKRPPEVPDLYSDGPPASVHTLLHVVRIFFESEIDNLGQYELIPIAQLVRIGEAISLSETFVPPCYAMAGAGVLARIVSEIRDEMAARVHHLQEFKSPRDMHRAELDSGHMELLLALRSLNRTYPHLLHLTQAPEVHPWIIYGALRQLVGELSSFSDRFDVLGQAHDGSSGLPSYDHSALYACFAHAKALIGRLLNDITVGPEHLTALAYCNGVFAGELPRTFFDRRNRFYLVLHSEQVALLALRAQRDARLASASDIGGLVAHALPGLELIHLATAPQGVARRANACYFRIEQVSELWDAVERQESIALQWPDAPEDLRVEVVVLRR